MATNKARNYDELCVMLHGVAMYEKLAEAATSGDQELADIYASQADRAYREANAIYRRKNKY